MILGVENYENTHKITYNYEKKIGVQKNDQKCPDPNYILYYLRALGIRVVFLPPYCPFFNPIEYLFGLIKKSCRSLYKEGERNEKQILFKVLLEYKSFDLKSVFKKCGYKVGYFDPFSFI